MLGSRSLRRLPPDIAVVKAADTREPYNSGLRRRPSLHRSARRRISQLGVDALGVVVGDIVVQQAVQMLLVENDHVIQQLPTGAAHPALCCSILPWTFERGALRLDVKILDRFCDLGGEDRVVVEDQVARS
jgi:hypothetical protein